MYIDICLILLLMFSTIVRGVNMRWAVGLIVMFTLLLLAARLFSAFWTAAKIPYSRFYIPIILFIGYAGIQWLIWRPELGIRSKWMIYTVERDSTGTALLICISLFTIIFLVHSGFSSRPRINAVVIAVIAWGICEAIFGYSQYFGDISLALFGLEIPLYYRNATGTLLNHNHYALLMNLCVCTAFGYLYSRHSHFFSGLYSVREYLRQQGLGKLALLALCICILGLAVVLSRSRMGIVAMVISIGTMMLSGKIFQRSAKRIAGLGLFLLVSICALSMYTGLDPIITRFRNMLKERETQIDRIVLWKDVMPMIQRHPLFGQGLGTFEFTYPAYETLDADIPAYYAHNDYLQVLAETGIVGTMLLLWALMEAWRIAAGNIKEKNDSFVKGIGLGTIGSLTAIMLQEFTDFALYTPGIAVVVALLIGINLRASLMRSSLAAINDRRG
jgi:O-antigen ligase